VRIRGAMQSAKKEDVAMSVAVMMNQMFRVGVGFVAWCALRQVLMVWLTYV
jgi:hypothetical protein